MLKLRKLFAGTSLIMMLIITTCVDMALAQSKIETGNTRLQLPEGNWSFTAHPDFRPGFNSAPVYLYEVTYDCKESLAVTQVALWNRTNKSVSSVKIGWWLSTEDNQSNILLQGETLNIAFEKRLVGDKTARVEPNLTPFTDFARTLLSSSAILDKDYRLDVAVISVTFSDGTVWNRAEQQAKLKPVSYSLAQQDNCGTRVCQNQKCTYTRARGQHCTDSTCERCAPVDEFRCTLGSCFGPVGP